MNLWVVIVTSVVSCLVSFFLGGGLAYAAARCKGGFKREKAMQEGVKCLLRSELIDYHEKYVERGSCPLYVKESTRRIYEAYHELGGNGVITKLYQDLMALAESKKGEGK